MWPWFALCNCVIIAHVLTNTQSRICEANAHWNHLWSWFHWCELECTSTPMNIRVWMLVFASNVYYRYSLNRPIHSLTWCTYSIHLGLSILLKWTWDTARWWCWRSLYLHITTAVTEKAMIPGWSNCVINNVVNWHCCRTCRRFKVAFPLGFLWLLATHFGIKVSLLPLIVPMPYVGCHRSCLCLWIHGLSVDNLERGL